MIRKCKKCRYYQPEYSNADIGDCYYNPPVVGACADWIYRRERPKVNADEFCSKWTGVNENA